VEKFRQAEKAAAELKFEGAFCLQVADHRDQESHDAKVKALIDFMWGVWSGLCDEDIKELCAQDMQATGAKSFLWHQWLQENSKDIGLKYRAFISSCQSGPIDPKAPLPSLPGASELPAEEQEELVTIQKLLLTLRRGKVAFVALPDIGGASGAEYSRAQMDSAWNDMRLGHRYARKKDDVRAFVLSADVFPPNLIKHSTSASLTEPIAADETRMKRVLDFMISKRTKDDLILLFDGRSRAARQIMEQYESKLAASGAHRQTEIWIVYKTPLPRKRTPGFLRDRPVSRTTTGRWS